MVASGHNLSRSDSVANRSGKAGSKYTQSAARITFGFRSTMVGGSGSPLRYGDDVC